MKDNQSILTPTNEDKSTPKTPKVRRAQTIDINSLNELTFERFLNSDMNKFSAVIVGTEHKVFQPKAYYLFFRFLIFMHRSIS